VLRALIPVLTARGVSVSTIKHAHEAFDVDVPGKDSFEHRAAGAHEVLVSSPARFALVHELRGAPERSLSELLRLLAPVDLVMIEGFKHEHHPKIEVHRAVVGKPLLFPGDATIGAVVTDVPQLDTHLPCAGFNEIERIADLLQTLASPIESVV
jgi:molybdopterin-guanine dinucleotide biosynthesis protein B